MMASEASTCPETVKMAALVEDIPVALGLRLHMPTSTWRLSRSA
jgi:hypothetical protein